MPKNEKITPKNIQIDILQAICLKKMEKNVIFGRHFEFFTILEPSKLFANAINDFYTQINYI